MEHLPSCWFGVLCSKASPLISAPQGCVEFKLNSADPSLSGTGAQWCHLLPVTVPVPVPRAAGTVWLAQQGIPEALQGLCEEWALGLF